MADLFPSISSLIPELKSGNEGAWNSLFEKFRAGLTFKTSCLLKNAKVKRIYSADDLIQEAYAKAWRQRESFRGKTTSQFAKWIIVILTNTFFDWCRRAPPEASVATWYDFRNQCGSPSAEIMSLEQEAQLHACLAELDPDSQRIVILRHFDGLKFSEIASRTNLNPNTVASIYRRSILRLSDLLAQSDEDYFNLKIQT